MPQCIDHKRSTCASISLEWNYKHTSLTGLSVVDGFLSFKLPRLFCAKYIGESIHSFEPNLSECSLFKTSVNLKDCGVILASESSSYVSTEVSTTPRTPRTEPREGFIISFPRCRGQNMLNEHYTTGSMQKRKKSEQAPVYYVENIFACYGSYLTSVCWRMCILQEII